MTPWVVKEGYISKEELELFQEIRQAVERLPDIRLNSVLSCHVLARSVKIVFGESLEVVDGHLYPTYAHSWLKLPSGNVIDVYPVGIIGGPLLVEGRNWKSPGVRLYLPEENPGRRERVQKEFTEQKFLDDVNQIALALSFARSEGSKQVK